MHDDDKRRPEEKTPPSPPDRGDQFEHSEGREAGVFVPPKVEIPQPPDKEE